MDDCFKRQTATATPAEPGSPLGASDVKFCANGTRMPRCDQPPSALEARSARSCDWRIFAEEQIDFGQEAVEVDWLRVKLVTPRRERLLARARHGMRSQGDYRNVTGRIIALEFDALPPSHPRSEDRDPSG